MVRAVLLSGRIRGVIRSFVCRDGNLYGVGMYWCIDGYRLGLSFTNHPTFESW